MCLFSVCLFVCFFHFGIVSRRTAFNISPCPSRSVLIECSTISMVVLTVSVEPNDFQRGVVLFFLHSLSLCFSLCECVCVFVSLNFAWIFVRFHGTSFSVLACVCSGSFRYNNNNNNNNNSSNRNTSRLPLYFRGACVCVCVSVCLRTSASAYWFFNPIFVSIDAGVADVEEEAKGRNKNSIQVKNPPGGKTSGPFW